MSAMGTWRRRRATRAILPNRFVTAKNEIGPLRILTQGLGRGRIFLFHTEKKGEGHGGHGGLGARSTLVRHGRPALAATARGHTGLERAPNPPCPSWPSPFFSA